MALPKLGFAKRLLLLYGLIFIIVIALTDWTLSRVIESRNLEALQNSLANESSLVAELVGPLMGKGHELQARVEKLGQSTNSRVTIVDAKGKVLADSSEPFENLKDMDNHARRPEIVAALNQETGSSVRYSMTLKTKMIYVAVPILENGSVRGVVRAAMPITRVDQLLASARVPIAALAFLGILIILVAGLFFAVHMTRRIRKITSVAERYAVEDWSEKVLMDGRDELKLLGDTMNHMASVLRNRIRDLEGEKGKVSAILLNMTEAVIAIARNKDVVMANPTAESLFNFSMAENKGKSLIETTRHPYLETLVDRALESGQTLTGEIQLSGKLKKTLRVSVVVTEKTVRDIGGILVFHDVTEIRQLENVRKEFVSNASHELRTPLTSLKGFIETLLGGASKDAVTSEKFLKIMQEDATRLSRLVEDMLTLGEIEQGTVPIKKESLDLAAEVQAVAERFKPKGASKKITLEDRLPQTPLSISGDRDKVHQVFVNLIDNAVKFTPEGGNIILSAEKNKDGVQITVQDTGCGIPEEAIGRIFERFFRVDQARSRELGGTGLGLSIVKHIMESHGGRATCQSTLGQGSSFSVFFPTPGT